MGFTPTLPVVDAIRPDEQEAYNSVMERQKAYDYPNLVKRFPHASVAKSFPGNEIQPYFAALLNSPKVAKGISDLGVIHRTRGEYSDGMSHADREWVDMVVCHVLSWNWVLYVHALDAVAVGVRPAAILALVEGRYGDLTEDEQIKASFIRAVVEGAMTEELYKTLEDRIGVRACVETTAFAGHLLMTMRLMQAFGLSDIPRSDLLEFLKMIVDGKIATPDPRSRVPADAGASTRRS